MGPSRTLDAQSEFRIVQTTGCGPTSPGLRLAGQVTLLEMFPRQIGVCSLEKRQLEKSLWTLGKSSLCK